MAGRTVPVRERERLTASIASVAGLRVATHAGLISDPLHCPSSGYAVPGPRRGVGSGPRASLRSAGAFGSPSCAAVASAPDARCNGSGVRARKLNTGKRKR
jgi:hypothetical protein